MSNLLTTNGIQDVAQERQNFSPTLQIIHIQPMNKENIPSERFMIILSDGKFHIEAICTKSLGEMIRNGIIKNFSVIRLEKFIVNCAKGRKLVVALKGSVMNNNFSKEIGDPKSFTESNLEEKKSFVGSERECQYQRVCDDNNNNNNNSSSSSYQVNQKRKFDLRNDNNNQSNKNNGNNQLNPTPKRFQPNTPLDTKNIVPIASLTPYRSKWTIKVRCTAKSDIRHWQKQTGSGKVMSVDLLDNCGDEIRATMFNDAVDKFEPIFEVNNVYLISKGRIKIANKQFTHIKHDYEITFDSDTQIEIIQDDSQIQKQTFEFIPINEILNRNENTFVDILAIVIRIDPISSVTSSKQNKQIDKRTLLISDKSASIEITLWNDAAHQYNETSLKDNPVIALKAARVSHFGGRSLSLGSSSLLTLNPDFPEVYRLRTWFESNAQSSDKHVPCLSGSSTSNASLNSISDSDTFLTLSDIKDRQLGRNQNGSPDYFVVKGTITSIRHDIQRPPFYLACTMQREGRLCNKKVTPVNNTEDEFFCEACNQKAINPKARYILGFSLNDHSGSYFMNCFNDIGEKIMGVSASQIAEFCVENDEEKEALFNEAFLNATFKSSLFKVRAKVETYNDEERVKCTVVAFDSIDYVKESEKLLAKLNQMSDF